VDECEPKSWWRLIWCYERCYKWENREVREKLRKALEGVGGSLTCLRKASHFVRWLDQATKPKFVLVTDWREAQPCLQALLAQNPESFAQPVCSIVLCSGRQLGRATDWSRRVPAEAGPVCIYESHSIPRALLGGLISEHFSGAHDSELVAVVLAQKHGSAATTAGKDTGAVTPTKPVATTWGAQSEAAPTTPVTSGTSTGKSSVWAPQPGEGTPTTSDGSACSTRSTFGFSTPTSPQVKDCRDGKEAEEAEGEMYFDRRAPGTDPDSSGRSPSTRLDGRCPCAFVSTMGPAAGASDYLVKLFPRQMTPKAPLKLCWGPTGSLAITGDCQGFEAARVPQQVLSHAAAGVAVGWRCPLSM